MAGSSRRKIRQGTPSVYGEPQGTYYRFFTQAGSAMAMADKDGILVASNAKFNELIQSLSGTAVDINSNTTRLGSSFDFLPIHDAVRFSNLLSKLANGSEDRMDFKTPYHDKLNKVHWFKIRAWKISVDPRVDLSNRGPFIGFILNDETVETEAEEKLQEEMRIAEKAMDTKSRFLAAMSHEIRTPIQTIIGMTELLEETTLRPEQAEYTRQIQFSAAVLLSLVNNILDYSKLEAGRMELECIAFSPAESILGTVEMLSPEASKKGLPITVDIFPECQRPILGDPAKFRQVLINLIKNAIKFTPQGNITLRAAIKHGADYQSKTITVAVEDTGIGIPGEVREKLFTTFMQAESSHTRRFGGTGLGLAISRNLVELMGGTIEMIPRPGGGSIFRFSIPGKDPPHSVQAPGPAPRNLPAPGKGPEPDKAAELPPGFVVEAAGFQRRPPGEFIFSAFRVLVVEDQAVNRKLFMMFLEKIGLQTLCANDGVEALEQVEKNPPDLIFMDIQMPRMNGYEAAAELRKRGFTKPLIAITAGGFSGERERCIQSGFNDILLKPFKKYDIEAMCLKWAGGEIPGAAEASGPGGEAAMPEDQGPGIFSRAALLDTFMNNRESAEAALSHFISRGEEQLKALPSLVGEENWEEAFRIAHTIKGSARTLSGMELGEAAAVLERACRTIDRGAMTGALAELNRAFKQFKLAVEGSASK
ncbi:MAG: response regulator [Spirochaetaceae bacterium]|jgi:signal transduction histidine kinase/CheY-like chemotaxis protein/HPt (histidine-containing phosphotransfer) domain-containing protein|nr:response regulator [Spirochaetaceae bacterium]